MKRILYLLWLFFTGSLAFAQSDNCGASATLLTPGVTCVYTAGNTTTGFTDSNQGCTAGTEDDDGWFRFVATATSHTITVDGDAGFDAVLGVYSNCSGTQPTGGTCIDASGDGGIETRTVTGLTVGNTYYICVHDWGTGGGTFQICVTVPAPPPSNDDPCSAIALTVGSSCSYSTYTNDGATGTTGPPAPGCANYLGGDVWFTAVVPASGRLVIDTQTGVMTDGGMAIYSGTCGSLTLIECDDDDGAGTMPMIDRSGLTPGSTIWIRVWEYGNDYNGTFGICVWDPCGASPTCNSIMGTGVINVASLPYSSGAGTTCGAGDNITSANAVTCGSTSYFTGEDQVFVFTPTSSGDITISLTSSGSWTGLMLYQGCPMNSCGVTGGSCIGYTQSSTGNKTLCATVTAGQTYYLVLDSYASPTCNAYSNLTISAPSAAPSCASLLGTGVISVASLPYSSGAGTTCGAGDNLTSTNMATCGSTSYLTGEDQVFVFTPTSSGCISIDLTSSGTYTGLMLYEGCPVGTCGPGSGTCVAYIQSSSGSKSMSASVTAGQTYYLVLDSYASPTCNAYTNLTISAPSAGPVNDAICNAQSLILGVPVTSTNVCAGASGEPAAPSCWTSGTMNTVWFSVVAPASGQMNIRTLLGTLTETQIQVFSSSNNTCTGTLTSIGCNQSFTACGNTQNSSELILTGLTAGNTYFIRVDGRYDLVGTFSLVAVDGSIGYDPIYAQDCANPIMVCGTTMNMGDPGFIGFGLTCDLPYPAGGCPASCLTSGEKNIVYYQFQAGNGTLLFTINPTLSSTDYDWSLYDITGVSNYCTQMASGALNPIRCSYAAPSGATGLQTGAGDNCEGAGGNRFVEAVSVTGGPRTYLLAISNFSGNNTGYQLDFTGTTALIPTTTSLVWSGFSGTDPTNSTNWSGCGVPSCGTDVEIFPGPTNQPVLATGQVLTVRNININPGAGITIQANADLLICGDFANYGNLTNFNALSETRFIGTAALQTISGYLTGTYSLGNVRIQKTGAGTVRITDDLECIGEFQIVASTNNTFNCNGRTLSLRANFTNSGTAGTFLHGNGTVRFIGTAAQTYTDPGGDMLYNVVINNSSTGVTLNSANTPVMNIQNSLNLTMGNINTNSTQYVHMQNTSLTSIINYSANSYINGRLRRNVSASGGAYVFPVGSTSGGARAGYHPFTLNFNSTNVASFIGSYLALAPTYSAIGECGYLFDCTYGNLGYWRVEDALGAFSGNYNFDATANTPTTPSCTGTINRNTVVKAPTNTTTWAFEGTTCTDGYFRNSLTTFSDFLIVGSSLPLPVEGMFLTATPTPQQTIQLDWNTNLEVNNRGFEVQRSLNGTNFEPIGFVQGNGNSQQPIQYQFTDPNVVSNQTYYYRLMQMDYDGNYKYSNVAEAIILTPEQFSLSNLYPNPTNGNVFVNVYSANAQDISVSIYNSIGQQVLHKTVYVSAGSTQLELPTQSLANGVYQVEFTVAGNKYPQKLSIVK